MAPFTTDLSSPEPSSRSTRLTSVAMTSGLGRSSTGRTDQDVIAKGSVRPIPGGTM
ncbi:hypothetical protein NA56DRAFT_641558 [Hyaloscypha hepaticicola]|uniref:Uncharacterized protein n=1 Tax=Hyaloscypha hepaticicola TaxID=2082293 RepID=A0A2J6QKX2_9HELO|nr:hypothetical protein NA56DRAFT_641558 [Hyaloscypha hepaticicola]